MAQYLPGLVFRSQDFRNSWKTDLLFYFPLKLTLWPLMFLSFVSTEAARVQDPLPWVDSCLRVFSSFPLKRHILPRVAFIHTTCQSACWASSLGCYGPSDFNMAAFPLHSKCRAGTLESGYHTYFIRAFPVTFLLDNMTYAYRPPEEVGQNFKYNTKFIILHSLQANHFWNYIHRFISNMCMERYDFWPDRNHDMQAWLPGNQIMHIFSFPLVICPLKRITLKEHIQEKSHAH